MNKISNHSKKIAKENTRKERPKKEWKKNFNTKMNTNNTFFEQKPDFDYLAIKYSGLEP